jgi:hypothetical protein
MDLTVKSSFVPPRPEAASTGVTKFSATVCINMSTTMVKGINRREDIINSSQHDEA